MTDLRPGLRQIDHRDMQVHPSDVGQLQAQVDRRVEHLSYAHGLCRWMALVGAAGH